MDKGEAKAILAEYLAPYRALGYEDLVQRIGTVELAEVEAPSGVLYQLEALFLWDGGRDGPVRVIVSVDDGGWRAFAPMSDDFIKAPDDSFVGE